VLEEREGVREVMRPSTKRNLMVYDDPIFGRVPVFGPELVLCGLCFSPGKSIRPFARVPPAATSLTRISAPG
jgi:hypothetical protein